MKRLLIMAQTPEESGTRASLSILLYNITEIEMNSASARHKKNFAFSTGVYIWNRRHKFLQ